MSTYKLLTTNAILRVDDATTIPSVAGNRDYQEYLRWIAAGNQPLPADPPSPTPPSPVYGSDASDMGQLADVVSQLRQFLGLATPTNVQVVSALKLLIRVVLLLVRTTLL
jgi:hypothetical protein